MFRPATKLCKIFKKHEVNVICLLRKWIKSLGITHRALTMLNNKKLESKNNIILMTKIVRLATYVGLNTAHIKRFYSLLISLKASILFISQYKDN